MSPFTNPRRALGAASLLALVAGVLVVASGGCAADIRPDALKTLERPKPDAEARGRALLARAAEVHGRATWEGVRTYTVTLQDDWQGLMPRMLSPWPETDAHVRMSFLAGSFDARVEFLDGAMKGKLWGMQSWKTYTAEPGKEPTFTPNDDARFIMPALQYLFEFHFRDHSGQVVSYAGPETVRGKEYERVFVTWEGLEPSSKVDQYMVYIDPKTGQVRKIFYTVREIMDMATGAIHFEDLREVDGVLFPYMQYVTFDVHDDPKAFAHRVTVESVQWNAPAASAFVVDADLTPMGDEKTSSR